MSTYLPRTAVIGAGISGLTSGKMLADYGVPYTCFESSDRIGGNWAFGNPNGHSSAYRSLHIDTSKHQLSFRDFPMPESYPDFPHHSEIKSYLDSYAQAFGLLDNIEFENAVSHARRLDGGGWELETQRGDSRRFDLLVVANGHHWDPRFPDFPGEFTGTAMHAHHYVDPKTPHEFSDKRILVVGLGNSAADIAVELSSKALGNKLTLSTRSGAWIVPKYFAGKPADRYYHTSPYIPFSWQRKFMQFMQPMTAGRPEDFGLPTPNHKFFEAHPTQSVELPLRLGSGDVIPKPNIARFDGETVHFEDGTSDDFDIIIYATGYNITFPFFDPDFISAPDNRIELYKRMFYPGIDDLVFAGFAQATPTLFPFVECQARLLGAYAVGRYRLPSEHEMHQVIAEDQQFFTGHMLDRPRHTQQLDHYLYEHNIRSKEMPAGLGRARTQGSPVWARVDEHDEPMVAAAGAQEGTQ
ncbi:flavin-containing monooxygenase [Gordonia sp. DT101]|uniref:flavin-containing monooxygenase n=1 Tax=Gordonia sp. DT101 TaxID=3416545 RepID=UPI003CECAFAF